MTAAGGDAAGAAGAAPVPSGGEAARAGRAVLWRAVDHGAGRLVSVVRFLVLSRLLAPEDFGTLAVATVAVELVLSLTNVGMVPALVQSGDRREELADTAWTVAVVRGAVVAAALLAGAPLVAEAFGQPEATGVLRFLALRPLLDAAKSIGIARLVRDLEFRPLAKIHLTEAVVELVVAAALAPVIGIWAVVVGALTASVTALAVSYAVAPHRPRLEYRSAAAGRLFRFGRWLFVTGVVGVVGPAVLRAVVSRRLGAVELGLYYLAARLAILPNEIVTDVVRAVAFPLHARAQGDRERGRRAFRATLVGMTAAMVPAYGLLFVLAPALVSGVLGPEWEGSVVVIRVLCLAGAVGALADATMPLLEGRGQPGRVTGLYVLHSVVVVALVVPLSERFGLIGAAWAWFGAEVAVQAACAALAVAALGRPFSGMARPLGVVAAMTAVVAAVAAGISAAVGGAPAVVLAVVVAGGLGAGAGWWLDKRAGAGLVEDLAGAFPAVLRLRWPAVSRRRTARQG